jgi:3-methyladenine DNA glycosylase Tag
VARLMADAGIVRNRLKIESTITNARANPPPATRHASSMNWAMTCARVEGDARLNPESHKQRGATVRLSAIAAAGIEDYERPVKSCFQTLAPGSV